MTFKDQINISWILFDNQEKNKKLKVVEKISGSLFKSGGHDLFIFGNVSENTNKFCGNRWSLEITRKHMFETSGRRFYHQYFF